MGCPQGSCSGPALWNLVANEILQETLPDYAVIPAILDDFAIISHAPTKIKIENQIHAAVEKFFNWANKNKLQISTGTTQYIRFSKLTRPPTDSLAKRDNPKKTHNKISRTPYR
ncbi:hypothetical protein AVEN_80933-1 [Araneus ventricosus]|uniref:Reverse transcriptase domain-containing protein n=1 Tax=Araneus ventricosus TaxID=182803 RepID=A0A4Y2GQ55_ARAVE|nr:hypothetical protein AVEN_80933-1 [Araneus ventricosus]